MSHQCPGPKCPQDRIADEMLACRNHWYQVHPATRRAVWQAWQGGAGAGSRAHTAALAKAVSQMTEIERAR